jgi:hypothetical protein
MSATPNFTSTPRCAVVNFATANTGRDGTGTIATLWTAGASGSRIDRVTIHGAGSTTAGMVRLWLHDGSNARLIREVPVLAITASGTVPAFREEIHFPEGLILGTDYSLRVSTHNAESFNAAAFGGDF